MLCFCSCSWATNLWYSIFALPGTTPRLPLRCNGARLFFGGSSVVSFRGLLRLSAVCDLDARLGWNFFLLVTVCGWLWLGTSASRCCGCRPRARTIALISLRTSSIIARRRSCLLHSRRRPRARSAMRFRACAR